MTRPTLTTPRLTLRPFTEADIDDVVCLAGDHDIATTTLLIPHPYLPEHARAWIAGHQDSFDARKSIEFAICECESGRLVGAVGVILHPTHDRGEIGYWIGKPYWGRGYATEAAAAVLAHGFATLKLHRIHAYHYTRNPASGRVLEKIGMRHEGRSPGHIKKWGTYEDCDLYGILRPDWERTANNRA